LGFVAVGKQCCYNVVSSLVNGVVKGCLNVHCVVVCEKVPYSLVACGNR
jgi:hypothetical protein